MAYNRCSISEKVVVMLKSLKRGVHHGYVVMGERVVVAVE